LDRLSETSVVLSVLVVAAAVVAFLVPAGTVAASSVSHPHVDAMAASSRGAVGHADPHDVASATPSAGSPPAGVASTTTVSPPPPPPAPAPTPSAPRANTTVEVSSSGASGYGCASAIAYLDAHAAPGYTIECPGYAEGHQAMTCDNVAGVCSGAKVIAIAVPCAAAYMNEASNSWVIEGESHAPIDPYGYCH
jgi:hypothetical protein